MKIDKTWLEEKGACSDGKEWFLEQGITEPIAGIMISPYQARPLFRLPEE